MWKLLLGLFAPLILCFQMNAQQMEIINAGISGNNTRDLLARLPQVLEEKPDWVLLMVGTNDMLNSNKFVSYEAYRQNLNSLIQKVRKNGASVVLITPPTVDSIYLFERHNSKNFQQAPREKLEFVRTCMQKLSKQEGVYLVDVFQAFLNANIPDHNEDGLIMNEKNSNKRDGVHPTPEGSKFIAQIISKSLDDQQLQLNGKVVCFGDSITFGLDVKGEGTVEGETYPAYLRQILSEKE